ncbi:MAG: helix-turn-helix domain-containing protein [Treponema sp.]|nr:helix-turn-helix domain-containing protein [Treponema sp.]
MADVRALLARNMKKYRQRLGLSQAALAERLNCSTTFVGNVEIGKRFPSSCNLDRIAKALDVKPAWLFADADYSESALGLAERDASRAQLERDLLEAVSRVFGAGCNAPPDCVVSTHEQK